MTSPRLIIISIYPTCQGYVNLLFAGTPVNNVMGFPALFVIPSVTDGCQASVHVHCAMKEES